MDRLWRSIPAKGQRDLWKRSYRSIGTRFITNSSRRKKNSLQILVAPFLVVQRGKTPRIGNDKHSLNYERMLSEEVDSLKETLDKHSLRQRKRILEAKERAELFERANGESSHVLQIFDDEAQAMQSARSSSRMLDEAFETGVAILHKYSDQRDRLKSAQRKALDVLNTVGLSNSVLKLIEKRHRVDKRIAYGGMIITVVLMVAFWRWTH
uniref:Membrin-11 n=1 Tax=Aegilops tauschii TaxID=37682 RepID=M8C341_AEGTA